ALDPRAGATSRLRSSEVDLALWYRGPSAGRPRSRTGPPSHAGSSRPPGCRPRAGSAGARNGNPESGGRETVSRSDIQQADGLGTLVWRPVWIVRRAAAVPAHLEAPAGGGRHPAGRGRSGSLEV